ncbi:hypothetical protein [Hafnia paralvei]|uniref:hypothetical protein n=1 Tax=Hafnia paralvei TaxID=546367 RepID=UPI00300D1736
MNGKYSEIWLKDEFEESVLCLLLTSIEKRILKNKNCAPGLRISNKDMRLFYKQGALLPSKEIEISAPMYSEKKGEMIHIIGSGRRYPLSGCYGMSDVSKKIHLNSELSGHHGFNGYSYINEYQECNKLPNGWFRRDGGRLIKLSISSLTDKGLDGHIIYLTLNHNCIIKACDYETPMSRGITGKKEVAYSLSQMEPKLLQDAEQALLFAMQFEAAKSESWMITAKEDGGIVRLGCEDEEVKSLLYARKTPLTATGRKKPIMHLVEAHKRRIKNGTDIDISMHLRGLSSVVIGNTEFNITPPAQVLEQLNTFR